MAFVPCLLCMGCVVREVSPRSPRDSIQVVSEHLLRTRGRANDHGHGPELKSPDLQISRLAISFHSYQLRGEKGGSKH